MGDARFGYGQLLEDPSLYLVWITEAGIRKYLVVESTSNVLTGGPDPKMGFFQLAAERESFQIQLMEEIDKKNNDRGTSNEFRIGTGISAVVWAGCALLSGGACIPVAGIAIGAYWLSRSQDNKADDHQINIDSRIREIDQQESYMRGKFTVGMIEYDLE